MTGRPIRRGARRHWLAGLAVVTLVVLAVLAPLLGGSELEAGPAPEEPGPAAKSSEAVVAAPTTGRPVADPARGTPEHIRIPSIGVDADVVGVAMDADGSLSPPAAIADVGWWTGGAQPGSRTGAALLTAHTARHGDGAFDDLGAAERGDAVVVRTHRGEVRYQVDSVRDYAKEDLPAVSARLFGSGGAGRLVLVTCCDYRDGDYQGNTVVVARPVTAR